MEHNNKHIKNKLNTQKTKHKKNDIKIRIKRLKIRIKKIKHNKMKGTLITHRNIRNIK